MPELEILEAKVPVRTPVLVEAEADRESARGSHRSPAGSAAPCSAALATFSRRTWPSFSTGPKTRRG